MNGLIDASYEERVAQPCIGRERADLVLGGCAILEAVLQTWPCERLRVADRGLREGILTTLMAEDGVYRSGGRPGYWRR
jgi:exopolyphosphatase/guanosine-5'-triphosphate,3'-diphosphate pyrophosphatase